MIAIDARYVRERPSGIGAMVEALVRLVPPLMPDVPFVLLRHPLAPSPLSREPNVREVTVRAEANGPATLLWLSRIVDLTGVRVFHAPFNILPAGLGMPTVVTVHDLMWLTAPGLCGARGLWGFVQERFFGHGIRRALRQADRIIAVSHATRRAIAAVDDDAAARCRVIHHGIDPAYSPARTDADRHRLADARARLLPGADRYVLVVGQSAPYKNHHRAIMAFGRAFPRERGTHLVLIQRLGRHARTMLGVARAAGVGSRVHVLPTVAPDDLVALYRGALCLCQPSLVEGWGMPVSEALAAGCPVVASHAPAIVEVTEGAALHADATDTDAIAAALRRVADDDALRGQLVGAGLDRAAQLTWAEHARKTAQLYGELLQHR